MICLEDQYFSMNRILLLAIGLWPYQQSTFTRFQYIFFSAILTSIIIFQLTTFITLRCTTDHLIKVLSSVSFCTIFIIKYNAFHFNIGKVNNLLMQLQHIHNELKDENEISIIKKYDCIAKRYTIVLITLGICQVFIFIITQLWSNIVEVNLKKNVSRSYHFQFTTEYFIDQKKNFFFIFLHINVAVCIGMATVIAIGTMFITYLQHICGLFRIASYRIEHAINIEILQNFTLKNKILMTEGIICAVDIHRQAMKLSKIFMSKFEIMMLCLIACGVVCLSLSLFQIASSENNVEKFFFSFAYASLCIVYMFLANLMGQNITDHNNHVLTTAYNVQWYRAPLHVQRMLLFLLQRRTQEFTLNVGRLFNASIEGFATLLKASVSYFTVIYSMR